MGNKHTILDGCIFSIPDTSFITHLAPHFGISPISISGSLDNGRGGVG